MCNSKNLQSLLRDFYAPEGCSWCGDHDRKLYGKRTPLCGTCRNIKALMRKWEKHKDHPFRADELETAHRMARMAQDEKLRYGHIDEKNVDGVLLEHAFNQVAKIAIHQELPYNDANSYEEFFTLAQRRFLYYLLGTIVRIYERKHRRTIAAYATD